MTQSLNPSIWRVLLPPVLGGAEMPDVETTNAYKLAAADPAVERLIDLCVNELMQLVKGAGADHFAHAAVQGAATLEGTPAQWLEVQLGMLRAEIELTRKERATAADRRRAEREAAKPLFDAVSRLSVAAATERDAVLGRLQARSSDSPKKSRWTELRAAGLSDEQLARLDLRDEDAAEAEQVRQAQARLAVLDAQLVKCLAYSEDPLHDPEHVRGLGFDDLVDAHLAIVATATAA